MGSKYIIAVDGASKEVKDAITTRISGTGYGYWHWMEDIWLVAGVPDNVTPKSFSDWLEETPGCSLLTHIVIKVDTPSSYWGRANKQGWGWMEKYWK